MFNNGIFISPKVYAALCRPIAGPRFEPALAINFRSGAAEANLVPVSCTNLR